MEKRQQTGGKATLLTSLFGRGSTASESSSLKSSSLDLVGAMAEILLAELGESGSLSHLVSVILAGVSENIAR